MPIRNLKYKTLDKLIRDNLSQDEDFNTLNVINKLKITKNRGWLLKEELIEICYWKSPRAIRFIESNHSGTIKKYSGIAFATRSEELKITELTKLKGVSIPIASAILMLTNPKRYGVIDIRVWELLYEIGNISTNKKGVNFNFKEWYWFLMILRFFSGKYKVSARDIERTIFMVHKKHQYGKLYKN